MSDIYKRANAGRLTFKGGELAALKSIDKKKRKKKKEEEKHKKQEEEGDIEGGGEGAAPSSEGGEAMIYTIDASKKMKYEELFPVEARKFGYDPANKSSAKTVEEALDDRVRKKADRYCK